MTKADLKRPTDWQDKAKRIRQIRTQHVFESLVETLPYRESSAITERTIELLNVSLRIVSKNKLFQVLILLAPQPGNRLNGDGLHRYLLKLKMPQRDAWFGFATYHEIWEESSPTARLARWATQGPYPTYDSEVIELASIPLVWLLSSPNRFMRDWVTKALVELLHDHLDVMRSLVERFWTVDDPYIVQRVIVIAHGALLRSHATDRSNARHLVESVRRLVFKHPMRPDELMLDAARGAVRWAVTQELLPETRLRSIRGPYGFKVPGAPPTEATLKAKYGYKENQPDNESYSTINFSLFTMGDFGRYVVESGIHHF